MPPLVDLSIDFDFFTREEPEWDFAHSEMDFFRMLWHTRYQSINLYEETDPAIYADFDPRDLVAELEEKGFTFPAQRRVVAVADSHSEAFAFFNKRSAAMHLVNLDAHHDCWPVNTALDCGNWLARLVRQRRRLHVTQVYPTWKDPRVDGRAHVPTGRLDVASWATWPGFAEPVAVGNVFLCFSSAWVPPHHYPLFVETAQVVATEITNGAVLELGRGFKVMKEEYFPQSREENAALIVQQRAQWDELTRLNRERRQNA